MLFFNTETKEYPRFKGDMELLGWSEGQPLPENWVAVSPVNYPSDVPEGQKAKELEPAEVDGVWTQVYEIVPMTTDELALINAPRTAAEKLKQLGFTEFEIAAIRRGLFG